MGRDNLKLIKVLDELAENRCCDHGIHNREKANQIAVDKISIIISGAERRVALLYEKGEVYTGPRGSKS